MKVDQERLQRLLGGESRRALRQRLRRRFETSPASDRFTLSGLPAESLDAVSGLLGRPRRGAASLSVAQSQLDLALQRAGLAPDLKSALEALDGPITDRDAQRGRADAAWEGVFAAPSQASMRSLMAKAVHRGLLRRLSGSDPEAAAGLLQQAEEVLAALPARGVSRAQFAARLLGDAHGLDNGRPVATLVRRALDPEQSFDRARDVWATQGVTVNELAKPAVVLNLAVNGDGPSDRLLRDARAAGLPLHLSLRALLRHPPSWEAGQIVHICENPEVITAAADALGAQCPALVSIDGQLSAAPRSLLDQLQARQCRLLYHGDFDWPGIGIANHLFARYDMAPWRFSAVDYRPDSGAPLRGKPVDARWDPALAAGMRERGQALHEEAAIPELLADLEQYCRQPLP